MEVTQQQIIEALTKNPDWIGGVMPTIQESEVVQKLINNKATAIYQSKIDDEIKAIHTQYDNDLFEILGERPENKDGKKQKTYDKLKEIYSELKTLRETKDSLNKDAKVKELQDQIEKLKNEGGGKHIQEQFDQAKLKWEQREAELNTKIEELGSERTKFLKEGPINEALAQIKFTPETPESVKQMVLNSAKSELINKSELRDGKLVFVGEDGKVEMNSKYEPKSAIERVMEMEAVKDISLKDDGKKGGGAEPNIQGGVITTSVEGKDVKKLNLPEGSFKSKAQFIKVAEKALTDAGFTVRDKEWTTLKDQAYKDHKVSELPTSVQ
jgi:hypothetical protein